MIKRMVTLLCALSIIAAFVPSTYIFAKDANNAKEKAIMLQSLGIDDAAASGIATNDYLITALSGFLYEKDENVSAEDFARSIGIIEYGEVYNGSKEITTDEALEYAVAALGYKGYAESQGKGGIRAVASTLGLIRGMGALENTAISVDECRTLLYNMLEVEPMTAVVSEGQVKHMIEGDQTLLSKYRNVHKIRGVLTSDGITSLDKENGCKDGYISIDNTLYIMEENLFGKKLLGKNIEAYVAKDDEDDLTVLYLKERTGKNRELILDTRDIEGMSSDYSRLDYYEGNKTEKAKIAAVPKVIFNGVFYSEYKVGDFKPEIGNLRLLDNDNDGKYDVIFINSYETVVVDAVDSHKKIIYNKIKTAGSTQSISLDAEVNEIEYTIQNELGEVKLSEIKKGDILSVAKSKSAGNVVIEIMVSREATSGTLQRIDNTLLEIYTNDEKYPITPSFLNSNKENGDVKIGNAYIFFIDALGNVAYWESVAEDGYAVMERAYMNWENERVYISYMNLNGTWLDVPIAKKFTLNENLYKDQEIALEMLKDIKAQIVILTFNTNGEIKKVTTATETSEYKKNKFTQTPYVEYTWRSGLKAFCDKSTYQCKYYAEDDAKLIVIPSDYRNRTGYEIRTPAGFFSADVNYKVSLYDIDEYGFSKIMAVKYEPRIKNTLFVVTKVLKIVEDSEARSQVIGYAGDFENLSVTACDDTVFGDVEKGDIIKVSLNPEGYADDYDAVFSLSDFKDIQGIQYQSQSYMAGTVIAADATKGRLAVDIDGVKYVFKTNNSVTVQVYDETEGMKNDSIYSIIPGDKIFIDTSWGKVQQIIIKR